MCVCFDRHIEGVCLGKRGRLRVQNSNVCLFSQLGYIRVLCYGTTASMWLGSLGGWHT